MTSVPNHDEGAPGPSPLGTGGIDTMQAQTSIRMPDTFMTPPVDCLLRAASAHPSISTGKERDAESGNDYFEARDCSRAMGRFMSPDWNAKVAPVPYAKLDNPQTLILLSSGGGRSPRTLARNKTGPSTETGRIPSRRQSAPPQVARGFAGY